MIKNILSTIDISRRHLNYLLSGARNASPKTARRLEAATGIPKEVWIFGTAEQRQDAFTLVVHRARP
jgi:plasmid maintenance system antidote protein VapI